FDAAGRLILSPSPPAGVSSAALEAEKDRIEEAEMRRRLLREPFTFCRKFFVQLATFWYLVETRAKSLVVGAIAIMFLVLAGAGVLRLRRAGVLCWPVVAVLVYLNSIYAAFLAFARYSMPLFPTLTVLCAGAVAPLAARLLEWARPQHARGASNDELE